MSATRTRRTPRTRSSLRLTVAAAGLAVSTLVFSGAPIADAALQPAASPTRTASTSALTTTTSATSNPMLADDILPIKRITLYRSGVGYFERSGNVKQGDVQLRFNTDQINDILKSMVVIIPDPRSGRLDTISYGSKEPLSRRLGSFAIDIADNPGIPELLNRLRGERLSLDTNDGVITGTVLGVETRTMPPVGEQRAHNVPHVNLITDRGLRSIPITNIRGYEILDRELAAELNRALATLAGQRAERVAQVDLRFSNESNNTAANIPVVVAYVHETPVWKTSYRLVLPEFTESAARAASPSLVQGWAIVENTTDQDWTDVSLGLVSGRPVSFTMDLHEPLFAFRPDVPVPTVPGVTPRVYAAGTTLKNDDRQLNAEARRAMAAPSAPAGDNSIALRGRSGTTIGQTTDSTEFSGFAEGGRSRFTELGFRDGLASQQAQAVAAEVGQVFQYNLSSPVTIERQRSAMIPIINAQLDARRVSIFTFGDTSTHPLRGIELTNNDELQLLPGPISVYDGAAYAGDAQIGHIGKGDKRLLTYAVDLDVNVEASTNNRINMERIRIVGGLIEQRFVRREETTYKAANNDNSTKGSRTLLIEHPRNRSAGWALVSPPSPRPAEQTENLYRFELPLAPGESREITVAQEITDRSTTTVVSFDMNAAISYNQSGVLSNAVLQTLREVARRQNEINALRTQIDTSRRRTEEIDRDQQRLRANMQAVNQTSDLYARYLQRLSEQETELETLLETRTANERRFEQLRTDLNTYIAGLNIE